MWILPRAYVCRDLQALGRCVMQECRYVWFVTKGICLSRFAGIRTMCDAGVQVCVDCHQGHMSVAIYRH